MGTIRLGKRTDNRTPMVKDFVPLASLDDLVFGGWDIFEDNCYEAAKTAGVLDERLLDQVRAEMEGVKPMKAVFDPFYVKRLHGPNVKTGKNKRDLADQVRDDIRQFKAANKLRPAGDDLVRQHGDLRAGGTGPPERGGPRKGPRLERSGDPVEHDLRLRRHQGGDPVRQRRPQPERRHPGPAGTGGPDQGSDHRQGLQDRADADQVGHRPRPEGPSPRRQRLVFDQHPGQPRRRGPRRSGVVQDQGREQEGPARLHLPGQSLPGSLRPPAPRRPHQLLPAARRQQRGLGQHRSGRLARLRDAAEDQFPVPRQHPGGAARPRPRAVPRPGAPRRPERHPGMAVVLLEEPAARARRLSGARPLHPVDEAEEHAALPQG